MTEPQHPGATRPISREAVVVHVDPLRALFDDEYQPMLRLASAVLGDPTAAEEAVQDAFVAVSRVLPSGRIENAAAYLRTAVMNASRSQMRAAGAAKRRVRAVPGVEMGAVSGPEDTAIQAAAGREVMAVVDGLPRRQRECLVLRYFAGLSDTEIASTLGISVGNVKSTIHRALEKLRTKGLSR